MLRRSAAGQCRVPMYTRSPSGVDLAATAGAPEGNRARISASGSSTIKRIRNIVTKVWAVRSPLLCLLLYGSNTSRFRRATLDSDTAHLRHLGIIGSIVVEESSTVEPYCRLAPCCIKHGLSLLVIKPITVGEEVDSGRGHVACNQIAEQIDAEGCAHTIVLAAHLVDQRTVNTSVQAV